MSGVPVPFICKVSTRNKSNTKIVQYLPLRCFFNLLWRGHSLMKRFSLNDDKNMFFIFYPSPNVAPKPTDQSRSNSILRVVLQLSPASPFLFGPKQETEWQTWNFTNMLNCFRGYVIKSAGETTKKVLLSVIWNVMLIEINLSQIMISDSKCEKVCAVCPYLLLWK